MSFVSFKKCPIGWPVHLIITQAIVDRRGSGSQGHVTVGHVLYGRVPVIAIDVYASFVTASWLGQLVALTGKSELTSVITAAHVAELVDCFLNIGHNIQNDLFALPRHVATWHCSIREFGPHMQWPKSNAGRRE